MIRQLSVEATQLSEQAQRSLLAEPAAAAPLVAPPAAAGGSFPWFPVEQQQDLQLTRYLNGPLPEPKELMLTRDWSSVGSTRSSSSKGSAWPPATSVCDFDTSGAVYAQGWGDGGDKRRRLAPGMLAHCLRPSVAAAVAEAVDGGEAAGGGGTLGRTPKRKLGQLAGSLGCVSAAAPDAATPHPAASPPSPAPRRGEGEHLEGRFSAAWASEEREAADPAAGTLAAAQQQDQEQRFRTFELFESKWHGCSSRDGGRQLQLRTSPGPIVAAGRQQRRGGICTIM
jgi:hypothetical protein